MATNITVVKKIILALCILSLIPIYIGYNWFRYSKIKDYLECPSILLEVEDWHITSEKGKQKIDVGYATFFAPENILHNPTKEGNYCTLIFNPSDQKRQFIMMEPYRADFEEVLENYNKLFDPDLKSFWDLMDLSMDENGFTFKDMLTMGIRERQKRAIMVMVKYMRCHGSNRVFIHQNEFNKYYIFQQKNMVNVVLRCKSSGLSQGLIFSPEIAHNTSLIDSILLSYKFDLEVKSVDHIRERFEQQNFSSNQYHNKASERNAEHAPRAQHPSS